MLHRTTLDRRVRDDIAMRARRDGVAAVARWLGMSRPAITTVIAGTARAGTVIMAETRYREMTAADAARPVGRR